MTFFPLPAAMTFANPGSFSSVVDPAALSRPINPLQALHEQLRQLPQVTIAVIDGYVRGGGYELALACDMRFALHRQEKERKVWRGY